MSAEPPSSGRPAGPPSGPLSGPPSQPPSGPPSGPPSQPPSGPPSQPSDAGSPGDGGGEPRRSRWKSAPRIALITTAVVAVTALALVLALVNGGGSGSGGGGSGQVGEVFLQPAGKTGPEPYTAPPVTDSSFPPASVAPSGSSPPTDTVSGVDGGDEGLYGGTRNVSSCDVERQIKALRADPAKNRAFASVAGVAPSGVPAHLRSLTPVQLRLDTRVTNHGYRDGAATTYQAVLQAGTAVLVDRHGVPRVRCACGNPLTPPLAQRAGFKRTGDPWPSYSPATTVVVKPSVTVVDVFVLYDPRHDHHWFARRPGDKPHQDRPTRPPARLTPSITVSTPSAPTDDGPRTSPPCVSPPADRPPGCPLPPSSGSSTAPPSSESPSSEPPSKEPPSKEPPSKEPPSSPSSSSESRRFAPPSSESSSSESPPSEPPSSGSRSDQHLVPDSPGSESQPSSPSEPTSESGSSSAASRLPLTDDSTSQSSPTSADSSGASSPAPGAPAESSAV
ncbi:hypothetical protein OV320_5207 [Actinobacteria bacterium OV320]|nr:hypothetical protein OV320_5207 [Actinobacteria bacterium OV320]